MRVISEELEESLELLSSPEIGKATAAFRIVDRSARALVRPYLASIVPSSGIEDVLQEVSIKIWCARQSFTYLGLAPWRGWIRRIAWNAAVEWLRENRNNSPLEDGDEGRWDSIDLGSEVEQIAGNTWFCYAPSISPRDRDRMVLAAQLHFEDGLPWQTICLYVHGRSGTATDRQALDEWLDDVAVLRDFAYRKLHRSGTSLVGHLLELEGPIDLFLIADNALTHPPEAPAHGNWKQGEILPIVWRYGFGLSLRRLVGDERNVLTEEELKLLFGRCRAKLPFLRDMVNLMEKVGAKSAAVFERQRVFKRLAFEYGCREDMPQKDVLERVEGPAQASGYQLTPEILTMWLSGRRLVKELQRGRCS